VAKAAWFGVVAGATDSASALTTAFNVADIKHIELPAGDIRVNSNVLIERSDLIIQGQGKTATRFMSGSATADCITVGDNTTSRLKVLFRDVGFGVYAGVTKTAGAALRFRKSNACEIVGFQIDGAFQYGVQMEEAISARAEDGACSDLLNSTGVGVYVHGAANSQRIIKIYCNAATTSPRAAILVEETGEIRVTDCDGQNSAYGLEIKPAANRTVENVWTHHNRWDTCDDTGIRYDTSNTNAILRRVISSDDWSASNGEYGWYMNLGGGTMDDISINAPSMYNNGKQGIYQTDGVTNLRIINAAVAGNSQDTTNTYAGITLAGSSFQILGGRSGSMAGFSNTQKYGIEITNASADNFSVTNVDLRSNATATFVNAAGYSTTKKVRGNLGWKTEARGLISGTTNASGDLTIAHGLDVTPTFVSPWIESLGLAVAQPNTVGAVNFSIRVSNAAGAIVSTAVSGWFEAGVAI
jgi:hypothetical protein